LRNAQNRARDKTSKNNVRIIFPLRSGSRHRSPIAPCHLRTHKAIANLYVIAYTFHAYGRTEGIAGIIISDHEYPGLVAHQLLSKICDEFLSKYPRSAFANSDGALAFPELKDYIAKYQDPQQADSIMKIQKELDETKIVLHKTIESVLERGEKIDSLVQKSDGLSAQSKMFYTQAKKQNSCCVVM
jgi:synaptobrevin family protein YKT6